MSKICKDKGIGKIILGKTFLSIIFLALWLHVPGKIVDCSLKESNRKIYLDQDNEGIPKVVIPAMYDSLSIADFADYDNDGIDDILLRGSSDGSGQDLFVIAYGIPEYGSDIDLEKMRRTEIQLEEKLGWWRYWQINTGDVNGDRENDIIFLYYNSIRILLNNFNGCESVYVNESSENYISINVTGIVKNLYVDDFNGDKIDDISVVMTGDTTVYVLYGSGNLPKTINLNNTELQILKILKDDKMTPAYRSTSTCVLADINGDFDKDLIYSGGLSDWTINTPDYAMYGFTTIIMDSELRFAGTTKLIDMGMSDSDIFQITRHTKYTAHDGIEDRHAGNDLMTTLQTGDVNGDGYNDLFIGYYKTFEIVGEWNQMQAYSEIFLLYGREEFTYGFDLDSTDKRYTKFVSPYMDDGMGYEIDVCDVNGDGLDDFIFGDRNDQLLGTEVHKMYLVYGRTSYPDSVVIGEDFDYGIYIKGGDVAGTGDVNGDGYDDIAMNGVGGSYIMFGVGEKFSLSNELVRSLPPFYETSSLMSFVDGTQFRLQFKKGRPYENINLHLTNYGRQLPESLADISQGASAVSFYDLKFSGSLSAYTLECSFGYSDSLLHALGINQLDLTVSYYDEGAGLWSRIPSVIDTVRNLVIFETDHLSLFALTDTSNHLISSIDDESSSRPLTYELSQNYPNPFNPSTTISYSIPRAADVTLTIYNILGREVKILARGQKPAGNYEAFWDGTNGLGNPVSSGVYIYRMTTSEGFAESRKMLLLR